MSVAIGTESGTTSYRGRCRRGFFRVVSWLPVRISQLGDDAATELSCELDVPGVESVSVADDRLEARLSQIEYKLDLLLKRAGFDVELPLSQSAKREVELSGSGIRLQAEGVYRVGDLVKVELFLPEERGRLICLLGQVVGASGSKASAGRSEVALAFRSIRDRDREAIVRHAYEVQRLSLGRATARDGLR